MKMKCGDEMRNMKMKMKCGNEIVENGNADLGGLTDRREPRWYNLLVQMKHHTHYILF